MWFATTTTKAKDTARGRLAALERSFAVIEFTPDGDIVEANENFLSAMGYTAGELVGRHHRLFMDEAEAASPAYAAFWRRLREGEAIGGEMRRVGKGGATIWLQCTYTPIRDAAGRVTGVVKIATDITEQKLAAIDAACQLDGISASQAVIEFELDGTIRTANKNFCDALGYSLESIRGQHHGMFVAPEDRGAAYDAFWRDLRAGHYKQGQFRRVASGGRDVYILATYTPILGADGKAFKVVKFASDITPWVKALETLRAHLEQFAGGALDSEIVEAFAADYEPTRQTFNTTVTTIADMVGEIGRITAAIAGRMDTVANGASELSARSESQAASLEETSATMEQMSATIRSNAEGAETAQSRAREAADAVAEGRRVASEAVEAMARIRESAEQIKGITRTIADIAMQTNLLALNASVEAARAGESGKGFAVVASEVRALAQRCGEASKSIGELLTVSATAIDGGVGLVSQTDEALTRGSTLIDDLARAVVDIATATGEQASGVTEVTSAVRDLDEITQRNAAMSDSVSNDIAAMAEQARALEKLVGYFRREDAARPRVVHAA